MATTRAPWLLLLTLAGCELFEPQGGTMRASRPGGGGYASGGEDTGPAAAAPEPGGGAAPAVTTGLPDTAAHPSLAWILARSRDVPNITFGRTARSAVTGLEAASFVAERAIGDVAPALFRTRFMPRTADKLARVRPIHDAASWQAAQQLVREAKAFAPSEVAPIESYSDRVNAEGTAHDTFEVLEAVLADVGRRAGAPPGPIDDAILRPWLSLFELCNDDTKTELLERGLAHYVELLRRGRAPARTQRVAPRHLHPAVRTFLYIAGERMPLADFAVLLGIDATDTLRGRNTDVALLGADVGVHELAPRMLELCGATQEAATLRALPPIRDERSLARATDTIGSMGGYDHPNRLCIEAGTGVEGIGEANEAFGHVRQDINSHPYYARGALVGWLYPRSYFLERGVTAPQVLALYTDLLERAVGKLRRMPRRRETSREPED